MTFLRILMIAMYCWAAGFAAGGFWIEANSWFFVCLLWLIAGTAMTW